MPDRDIRVLNVIRATGIAGAEKQLLDVIAADHLWEGFSTELRILVAGDFDVERVAAHSFERGRVMTLPMASDVSMAVVANLKAAFRDYDIVHTHLVHADWHALLAGRSRRAAWVSTKHNHDRFRQLRAFGWVEREVDRRADATVAISRSLADFTQKHAGRMPTMVPYGWGGEVADFSPARAEPPYRMLAVGRLVEQKGFDALVDALPRVLRNHPDTMLTIAGDGPGQNALEEQIRAAGVDGSVRMVGWVDDIRAVMADHDLMVHPARWEGFGLVLLEAMAAGLPVIGSTAGAIPEVLGPAAVALVRPDSPDGLATEILRALDDTGARERARELGLETVRSRLSLDRSVAALREVYGSVLRRRTGLPTA